MWRGKGFCQVISEQEQFDELGNSLGIQPISPHIVVAAKYGLRCEDRTDAALSDRPLISGIESFAFSANTPAPFEAAEAGGDVGLITWDEEEV